MPAADPAMPVVRFAKSEQPDNIIALFLPVRRRSHLKYSPLFSMSYCKSEGVCVFSTVPGRHNQGDNEGVQLEEMPV